MLIYCKKENNLSNWVTSSNSSWRVYKNIYCALCHGESIENLFLWKLAEICQDPTPTSSSPQSHVSNVPASRSMPGYYGYPIVPPPTNNAASNMSPDSISKASIPSDSGGTSSGRAIPTIITEGNYDSASRGATANLDKVPNNTCKNSSIKLKPQDGLIIPFCKRNINSCPSMFFELL